MSKPLIADVSDTAIWVAHYRAEESARPDALFKDPFASRLAGEKGEMIAKSMTASIYTGWAVTIRTCIIDRYIEELIAAGVDTIVNLGCGLDARPYRMNLPADLRWYEVDYPHIIDLKEERLKDEKPKCKLERIKLDLANLSYRRRAFTDIALKSKKVLVLTEGVVPYLRAEQVAILAGDLRNQEKFKYWIIDYFSPAMEKYFRRGLLRRQMQNAPMQFFVRDWFGFFAQHGWKQKTIRYLAEESVSLNRTIPMPWWARILSRILPRKGPAAYRRFAGYVLLEAGGK